MKPSGLLTKRKEDDSGHQYMTKADENPPLFIYCLWLSIRKDSRKRLPADSLSC